MLGEYEIGLNSGSESVTVVRFDLEGGGTVFKALKDFGSITRA